MNVFETPGAFSWNELISTDPAAAATFYRELFGWTVQEPNPQMGGYRVVQLGEAAIGGIMGCPEGTPKQSYWGGYVTVADLAATVAKCEALGGKVAVPPMDIPNVGRMAVLMDPTGAILSAIQYKPM